MGVGGGRGLTPLNAIPISTYSFNLEIFHSRILVIGVIDTVYTGFDFRTYLFICSRRGGHCLVGINGTNRPAVTLYYLLSALGIYAYDESVDVRWSYTTLVRWISEADDHRREIVLAGRQPVRRCILLLVLLTFVI